MITTVEQLKTLAETDPGWLLKPGEVAAIMRVDPKTVTRWVAAGKLPAIRTPGKHRRVRAGDLYRAIAEKESPGS